MKSQFIGAGGSSCSILVDDLSGYSAQMFSDSALNGGSGFSGAWGSVFTSLTPLSSIGSGVVYWLDSSKFLFTPDQYMGPLFFDAQYGVGDASPSYQVSEFPSYVAGGLMAPPTNTLNGLRCVQLGLFNGLFYRFFLSTLGTLDLGAITEFSIYAVARMTSTGDSGSTGRALLSMGGPPEGGTVETTWTYNAQFFFGTIDGKFATYAGSGLAWVIGTDVANSPNNNISSATDYHILGAVHKDSSGLKLNPYVDGTGQTQKTGYNLPRCGFSVGGMYNGSSNPDYPWEGDLAELIITTDVSDTARQSIEGYLAWKWGLQANLPGGHPYKLTPP